MKLNEFEVAGGKVVTKTTCDPRLPCHYLPKSHDGHLGATEQPRDNTMYDKDMDKIVVPDLEFEDWDYWERPSMRDFYGLPRFGVSRNPYDLDET